MFQAMAGRSAKAPIFAMFRRELAQPASGGYLRAASISRFDPISGSRRLDMRYRNRLPQLGEKLFLTDGGMETTFVFHDGIDLPCFAAFDLMKTEGGVAHIRRYYERYIAMAREAGLGFVLESPTWRANRDWGAKLGYSADALAEVNRRSVALMADLRARHETTESPMVVSGNVGPRGDGYVPGNTMTAAEAQDYHAEQIAVFRETDADMVSAFTIPYVEEAVGIARAAKAVDM